MGPCIDMVGRAIDRCNRFFNFLQLAPVLTKSFTRVVVIVVLKKKIFNQLDEKGDTLLLIMNRL